MMKHQALLGVIFGLLLGIAVPRSAQAFVELNAFYFSDSMSAGTSTSASRTFIEGTLGFMIDKKGDYLVGWAYSSHSSSDSATSSTTYSSTQMGPRFIFMFDKAKHWSLGLGYYLVTSAEYSTGSAETWKGYAIKADAGYAQEVSQDVQLGVRLNYSLESYNEKLVGGTTYSTISYTRSFIYPSLYAMYLF